MGHCQSIVPRRHQVHSQAVDPGGAEHHGLVRFKLEGKVQVLGIKPPAPHRGVPRQLDLNHVRHLVDILLNGRPADEPVVEKHAGSRRVGRDGDGNLENAGDVQDVRVPSVRPSGTLRPRVRADGELLAQQPLPFALLVQPRQVRRNAVLGQQGQILLRVVRLHLLPLHLKIALLPVFLQELVEQGGRQGRLRHVARLRRKIGNALRILPGLPVRGGMVLFQDSSQRQRGTSGNGPRFLLVRKS